MKGSGQSNTLNLEADKRPGDPTAVSDPACWIAAPVANAIQNALSGSMRIFRGTPTYREPEQGVLDVSDDVDVDPDGKLRSKF